MFRTHEKTIARKSGLLALLVHAVLVGALLFSFNWKAAHTVVSVSEVELWNELPNNTLPPPKIEEPTPQPEIVEEPEPEPEVVEDPTPEPEVVEEPKVDIELENKKKAEEKKRLEEEKKKLEAKKKLAEKKAKEKKRKEKERREKLKKLQEAAFDDEVDDENDKRLKDLQQQVGQGDPLKPSGASKGEVNKYVAKIQAKIKGNLIRSLCAEGNPQLVFNIKLLPTGEFASSPSLKKSSGNAACDDAVERAIIASEPLPIPTDADAFDSFRNLNLSFRPND